MDPRGSHLESILNTKLEFLKHISIQVNESNRVLGAVTYTFAIMDVNNFLPLYRSIIRPQFKYAMVIWSPKLKTDKDALERIEWRARRLVSGLPHLPYPERLQKLNLPTVEFQTHEGCYHRNI